MNTTKNPMEAATIEEGKEIGMYWMQKFYYSLFECKALRKIMGENGVDPTVEYVIEKMNSIEQHDFADWKQKEEQTDGIQ